MLPNVISTLLCHFIELEWFITNKHNTKHLPFLFVISFGKIAKCWIVTFFNRIATRTICIHRKLCGLKYLTSMISTRSSPVATNIRINVLLCKYQWLFIFYVSSKVFSLNINEVQLVLVHIPVK